MSRVLPILFNTDMVRAILDGKKTVTRRVIKPQPTEHLTCGKNWEQLLVADAAPYQPGDILYVRETWCDDRMFTHNDTPGRYFYKASDESADFTPKWRPSIHMPKEAARIWLKVKDVLVERLQDMNEVDTAKEGIRTDVQMMRLDDPDFIENFGGIELFKDLWNSTIKKSDLDSYGWDVNPWVWVIEFERCEKPENF